MKVAILSLVLLSSPFSFAKSKLATAAQCQMKYSVSGVLNTRVVETSGYLVGDSELEGAALSSDGDQAGGRPVAHYTSAERVTIEGESFYQITVRNSEKSVVGIFSFPEASGMQISIPTSAMENEAEDPVRFDTLTVTCKDAPLAG